MKLDKIYSTVSSIVSVQLALFTCTKPDDQKMGEVTDEEYLVDIKYAYVALMSRDDSACPT